MRGIATLKAVVRYVNSSDLALTYTEGCIGRRFSPQLRQTFLRRALSVRHLAQVMYMVRAKRLVTTALTPRMAATSVIWSRVEPMINNLAIV
jgi:hypothetical protein